MLVDLVLGLLFLNLLIALFLIFVSSSYLFKFYLDVVLNFFLLVHGISKLFLQRVQRLDCLA